MKTSLYEICSEDDLTFAHNLETNPNMPTAKDGEENIVRIDQLIEELKKFRILHGNCQVSFAVACIGV